MKTPDCLYCYTKMNQGNTWHTGKGFITSFICSKCKHKMLFFKAHKDYCLEFKFVKEDE